MAELLEAELKVINVGLELFHDALVSQGVESVHVNWRPLPKLEEDLERILSLIS